ncbi:Cof-type HAD-IIB family hydrolase [Myxococcus sp. CA033]|uniref:Cof-type HAD-IIB family hydrolase n=1 Tax=Myxococcus sp. CA033 TaxID=2741516 RepID=UPI00157B9D29|nr:Cof-type HAD-IIB family hydrolase [Myxococcus sp. CA033]NTX40282.1 Cof-type HAD-IIB family hydrolase [Myxococcus sp. CA033]
MAIRLLIADIDGTMVTQDKVLTERTREAVARLRSRGIQFTVTSGRPPRGMAGVVAALKLTAPLAAFNGGVYVQPDLTTTLAQRTLPLAVARQAIDHLLRAGLDVWVYQGADWFLRDAEAFRVARERNNLGFDPTVVQDLSAVLDEPIKIVGVSEDRARVERCEAELAGRLGTEASAMRSTPYYLDVTHPEANKGMVVREAARILQLPLDQIAAIGDMPNDLPMLKAAGLGIAMGNASDDVRRSARHVTRTNDEEGFAHAVETFILGQPPLARTRLGLPPRARACLFGLDDVLTQTASLQARAWKNLCDYYLRRRARASGQPFIPFDLIRDYSRHFDGMLPLDGIRAFLAARDIELPENTVRALTDRHGELLVEMLQHEHVEPYEGAVRYVQAARADRLRLAVVSELGHSTEVLQSSGLADLFDARVEGTPPGDVYLTAVQALGVGSGEVVVFADAPAGVSAARAGHFGYVVGVDRRGRAAELRRCGADIVVTDPAALLEQDGSDGTPPGKPTAGV